MKSLRQKRPARDVQAEFEDECEQRRNHIVQHGNISFPFVKAFTDEEYADLVAAGFQVPLDLVPIGYWWTDNGIPRKGEEALGKDF